MVDYFSTFVLFVAAVAPPLVTPTPTPVIPWFVILLAIVAAGIIVAVGYLVLKRKP